VQVVTKVEENLIDDLQVGNPGDLEKVVCERDEVVRGGL
jgi:hypothetical protein